MTSRPPDKRRATMSLTLWRPLCCHMGTAIKHPVPDRVKPFICNFWHAGCTLSAHFDAHCWASECPDIKKTNERLNPVWHRMLYSCTHMATVGVKGLIVLVLSLSVWLQFRRRLDVWLWPCVVLDVVWWRRSSSSGSLPLRTSTLSWDDQTQVGEAVQPHGAVCWSLVHRTMGTGQCCFNI